MTACQPVVSASLTCLRKPQVSVIKPTRGDSCPLCVQTFVISKEGKLLHRFNDQMNARKHVDEALRILEASGSS